MNPMQAEDFVLNRIHSNICYGILGSLLGSKQKSSQEESQKVKGTVSGTQQIGQTSGGTTATTGTTTQTGTQSTTQDRTSTGSTATRTLGELAAQGVTTKSSLDADSLARLTSFITGAAGNAAGSNADLSALSTAATRGALNFDPNRLAEGAVAAARQQFQDTTVPELQQLYGRTGGTGRTNTGAALVASREARALEASLAGVRSGALLEGEKLRQSGLSGAAGVAGAGQAGLIEGVRAISEANQTINTNQTQTSSEQQTALTKLAELVSGLTNQSQTTNTSQLEQVAQFMNQLGTSTEESQQSGTANMSGTGTSRGSLLGGIGKLLQAFSG